MNSGKFQPARTAAPRFAGMAIFLTGLFPLFFALDVQAGTARWATRTGTVFAAAALALYGGVLAMDGVALKQAVNAWASAPQADKAARFANGGSDPLASNGV
jgi:hypothetical protein